MSAPPAIPYQPAEVWCAIGLALPPLPSALFPLLQGDLPSRAGRRTSTNGTGAAAGGGGGGGGGVGLATCVNSASLRSVVLFAWSVADAYALLTSSLVTANTNTAALLPRSCADLSGSITSSSSSSSGFVSGKCNRAAAATATTISATSTHARVLCCVELLQLLDLSCCFLQHRLSAAGRHFGG